MQNAGRMIAAAVCAGATFLTTGSPLLAQLPAANGKFQAIDQNAPVGVAAATLSFRDPGGLPYYQPVSVSLPTTGSIRFLTGRPGPSAAAPSPAQAALMVGRTYRLKITEMPEFPGAELYPSVEVLDRLHPPRGKEHDFPLPLELTREEIEEALEGRLVTKVIYLEKPSLATPVQQEGPLNVQERLPTTNLIAESDIIGRPMLLIRIGGRLPDPHNPDPAFFGTGAPVMPSQPSPKPAPPEPPKPEEGAAQVTSKLRSAWATPVRHAESEADRSATRTAGHFHLEPSKNTADREEPRGLGRFKVRGWSQSGGNINR